MDSSLPEIDNLNITFITYLVGQIAERAVAVELSQVRGVGRLEKIVKLPGAPKGIIGLMFFRGGIEPVLDLSVIWDNAKFTSNKNSMVALIEAESLRGLLLFDALTDMIDIQPDLVKPLEDNKTYPIGLDGEFELQDKVFWIISPTKLLRSFIQNT